MAVDFFYKSVPLVVSDMNREQLEREIESLDDCFEIYAKNGQGIPTKERLRRNEFVNALARKVFGNDVDMERLRFFFGVR